MAKIIPNRVFEDYEPPSDLVTEEECDTLLIYLPGYKKEQLRVQLTTSGMLKISGERPPDGLKHRRFYTEFRLPSNCDSKKITAKFEAGILYIRQPKLITPDTAPPASPQPQPQPQSQERKVVNYRLFRELRRPNNMKKLGVSVTMVLITAVFISYMFKYFTEGENESMMRYNLEF